MIYLITYDLRRPGQQYSELYEEIKKLGAWWHYLESTWLVDTQRDSAGIWNRLASKIDPNDYMLIISVTRDYQGWLPKDAWDWIDKRLHRSASDELGIPR